MADEYQLKDFFPFVAILGPILGAVVGFLLARRSRERRVASFVIARTEDLMLPLRRNQPDISLKVGAREFLSFNRSAVFVRNQGNAVIENFSCDILIPGDHAELIVDLSRIPTKVVETVNHTWFKTAEGDTLRLTMPFLNPKESFSVRIFFDGVSAEAAVLFRMQGVQYVLNRTERITAFGPELIGAMLALYPRPIRLFLQLFVDKIFAK